MVSREHRRVRMRLPARLRWTAPFGQKIELSESMDVSRGGLLLSSREAHAVGVLLWVTFPYDASVFDAQPEVAARVVRCDALSQAGRSTRPVAEDAEQPSSTSEHSLRSGSSESALEQTKGSAAFALAVHFEATPFPASNGNSMRHDPERRGSLRRALAVPVRVRSEHVPWFEEAMSLDFSSRGMRFRSHREYAAGELLSIALEAPSSISWLGSGEFRAKVVRVSAAADGVMLDIAVCRAA